MSLNNSYMTLDQHLMAETSSNPNSNDQQTYNYTITYI